MRAAVLALALMLTACGSETEPEPQREVEKRERHHDLAPMYAIDEALRTEAMAMFATLNRQITLAAARGDSAALYRALEGRLDATKLEMISMNEAQLKGTHYQASDYTINIAGNQMTITASKPGTRGHTSAAYTLR